jgi:hypothetical protein
MKKILLIIASILVLLIVLGSAMLYFGVFGELTRIARITISYLFIALAVLIVMQKEKAKAHWIVAGIGFLVGFWGLI